VSYLLHGTMLALAWFTAINLLLSGAVGLTAGRVAGRRSRGGGRTGRWLALRLLPTVAPGAFVAAVFIPSYWLFEPRGFTEGFDVTLTALAAVGLLLVGAGLARGAAAWRLVERRSRQWMAAAEPLAVPGLSVRAFQVNSPQPMIALVGIFRPRLLITRGLIDLLTPDELAAVIAHELGHRDALDNLQRLAMRAAPDLLAGTTPGRTLEREWATASEHHADVAASTTPRLRIALASALVKVARLMPPAAEAVSTLVGGGSIAARVEDLIAPAPAAAYGRFAPAVRLALFAAGAVLFYSYGSLLLHVHALTETVIRLVP
jgi:hypothetical protein